MAKYKYSDSQHRRAVGQSGERAALELYQKHGFTLIVTNFFNHRGKAFGEIDFAVCKNKHIHFVEVKTRSSKKFGEPIEAVTHLKQLRIRRSVEFFLNFFREFRSYQLHLDIASVEYDAVDKSVRKIKITSDAIES